MSMQQNSSFNKDLYKDERLISLVKKVVCHFYNQDEQVLHSMSRLREIVKLRQTVCYVVRTISPTTSLKLIGENLYRKKQSGIIIPLDHATVLYAVRNVQNLIDTDKWFKQEVTELIEILTVKSANDSEFWGSIDDEYFYLNLNHIKTIRISDIQSITFSGISDDVIQKIKQQYFPNPEFKIEEIKNTNLYLLQKKKNENNGNILKSV